MTERDHPKPAPVACTLGPDDAAERRRRWHALLATATRPATRGDDRVEVRWRLDRPDADELEALVAAERECCAFAAWTIEHDDGETTLRVTIPDDRAAGLGLIADLLDLAARSPTA